MNAIMNIFFAHASFLKMMISNKAQGIKSGNENSEMATTVLNEQRSNLEQDLGFK